MRILFIAGWLLLPVAFAFWHYGPGQEKVKLDQVADLLTQAQASMEREDWPAVVKNYEDALELLPEGSAAKRQRIVLEKAKAQMQCSELPEAHQALKTLVEELQAEATPEPVLLAETRSALAQAQFYMTWLMRLEGEPEAVWEPEIEAARQNYRLLAEGKTGAEKETCQKDLEAAVRLARMDLSELQGLGLPSCCNGCCSGKCKGMSKKKGKSQGPRTQDARGASSGPPPDGKGH